MAKPWLKGLGLVVCKRLSHDLQPDFMIFPTLAVRFTEFLLQHEVACYSASSASASTMASSAMAPEVGGRELSLEYWEGV